MSKSQFDPSIPIEFQISSRLVELKQLAYRQAKPGKYARENHLHYSMLAALVKKEIGESFEPIKEQSFSVYFDAPKTWLDHLKTHLPESLKFGWLKPEFVTTTKTVKATCQINILKYELVVTPTDKHRFVELVEESKDIDLWDDIFFRNKEQS
jgi:hypothetical protein